MRTNVVNLGCNSSEMTDVGSEERADNLPLSGRGPFSHFFFHNFVASHFFLHEKGL